MPDLLAEAYDATTQTVRALSEADFARPTRAAAWTVGELLYHQVLDAQRALVALASPTPEQPDVDSATYWRPFRPGEGDGGAAHARFVRVAASAFGSSSALVGLWSETSAAVVRTAAATEPAGRVRTQGHVIQVADLRSTLVVEATVHLLDLTLEVPGTPTGTCLSHTRTILESIHGGPLPVRWDDATAVLKGTGRVALDAVDLGELGGAVGIPLLG